MSTYYYQYLITTTDEESTEFFCDYLLAKQDRDFKCVLVDTVSNSQLITYLLDTTVDLTYWATPTGLVLTKKGGYLCIPVKRE